MSEHDAGRPESGRHTGRTDSSGPPLLRGAVVGALAFVAGYLATVLLSTNRFPDGSTLTVESQFGDVTGVGPVPDASVPLSEGAGLVFYRAHLGEVTARYWEQPSTDAADLGASFVASPSAFLYLLVPAVLVGAGYYLARGSASRPRSALAAGGTLVVGYFPLALVGIGLFEWTASNTIDGYREAVTAGVTVGPELASGVVLVGVFYPLAFGAAGGVVAHLQQSRNGPRARAPATEPGGRPGTPEAVGAPGTLATDARDSDRNESERAPATGGRQPGSASGST